MTLNEYQALAQRTANKDLKGIEVIRDGCYGLCGESGEVIDILKKHEFQGHKLDRNKMLDELGDVLWYVVQLATGLNVTLEEVAVGNIYKLMKRYPQGFEADRSINREV